MIPELKKVLISVFAAAMALGITTACSGHHKYKVGVSQCSYDDWRNKMNEEIRREAMFYDDIEVEIRSADDSSDKQLADLDYFLDNDFDIIVVAPNEADALTPKIKEIYESGKPVIMFDRTIHGDYYTAFQGANNEDIGKLAARYAATLSPNPRVLEIKGLEGSTPAKYRHLGFKDAADSLGFTTLAEADGHWNLEEARRLTDSLLRAHPEANIVYAHNDRMALGAREVVDSLGRTDIKIIGIDAAPTIGIQAVADGKIDATFLYPTNGYQLLRTARAILTGEPFERVTLYPASAPVDITNAEILLLQDNAMREETEKIMYLQGLMDTYNHRYAAQQTALYASVIILLLLGGFLFLLLRMYWNGKKHRREMEISNAELARQRDELDSLYRKLQEATGSKLTFFTNVSHDLRTPLTLIADPVGQMADAENITPSQRTLMQLANKNVKRLQRLINQILDIRKYDGEQLRLHLLNVSLGDALREWTAPFADMAARRHIRFSTDIPLRPQIRTAIDIEKSERVLFNLLSNAFKFTPENGKIDVTLSREGDNAIIRVADTGIGIPPDEINNIFERFFKTDRINPNGSGIGLALSKVFIDMHGGSISVESNEGHGTTFTVSLPIRLVEKDAELPDIAGQVSTDIAEIEDVDEEPQDIAEDTPTVLVIDDNRDICMLIKADLAGHYTVLSANNGARGLRLATKYIPDLIICDVMMPGMSGYDVCKALKSEPLTSHIPVLMLTACTRDEQRIESYDCGADAFMSKPFNSAVLLSRCKSLLDNRRLIFERYHEAAPAKKEPRKAADAPRGPVEDEFVARFTAVVESHLADADLSVESLADELGLSRVQMYRKIKGATNYSAAEFVRNIRLRRAAVMLKTSSATIAEVAYSVGFSSPSYFSRCYKDFFNETPNDTQKRTSKAQ